MGLAAPAMAQDVNYKDMLKPRETTLKAGNADPKAFAKEIKEYQKEFKRDPKALVALGNLLAMNKNYDQANAVADAVIAKFKNYGDAYILKGDIYAMQDNGGEAATWYGQCMTMDPKNPQGYISYSNVYRKIDPQASAEALNKLREINPNYPIEAEAGHNFFSAGNYEKAYEYFSKAKPNTLEEYAQYEYAFTAYIVGKKEESLSLCESGIQKFPKDAAMQVLAMRAAVDVKNFESALQHANIVMNTDSIKKNASIVAYYGLALAGGSESWPRGIGKRHDGAVNKRIDDIMFLFWNHKVIVLYLYLHSQAAECIRNNTQILDRHILDAHTFATHCRHADERTNLNHIWQDTMLGTMQFINTHDGEQVAGDAADLSAHRIEQMAELLDIWLASCIINGGSALCQY